MFMAALLQWGRGLLSAEMLDMPITQGSPTAKLQWGRAL